MKSRFAPSSPALRRIVVAPDKFKGSLTALEASAAIARGIARGAPGAFETCAIPMADGGEGTVAAFVDCGARRIERTVCGPLGSPVNAAFALDGETAIVEMAAASGLSLIASEARDPLRASTFGTGELILAALDAGARHVVVGLGGSATNDGGSGMLAALGVRFLDAHGATAAPGGAALAEVATIDAGGLDARLRAVTFEAAADVDNPLCGPRGASAVFGPQKGATPAQVAQLDAALAHYAAVAAAALDRDLRDAPGAGAAGGLGFALLGFLRARLRPGVEIVADLRGLPASLDGACAVFTGEGSIDDQTLAGKTVAGVAALARAQGVERIVAFGGRVDTGAAAALAERGVRCVALATAAMSVEVAMREAAPLLEARAAEAARSLARDA